MTQKQFDKLALAQVKEHTGYIGCTKDCRGMTRCRYVGGDAYKFYDIKKIADTFEAYRQGTLEDEAGFCAVKTLEDIKAQDYVLTPGRYVGIAEQEEEGEPFVEKMQRLTSELSELMNNGYILDEEIKRQLCSIGFEIG